jgi:hypothetical protein
MLAYGSPPANSTCDGFVTGGVGYISEPFEAIPSCVKINARVFTLNAHAIFSVMEFPAPAHVQPPDGIP